MEALRRMVREIRMGLTRRNLKSSPMNRPLLVLVLALALALRLGPRRRLNPVLGLRPRLRTSPQSLKPKSPSPKNPKLKLNPRRATSGTMRRQQPPRQKNQRQREKSPTKPPSNPRPKSKKPIRNPRPRRMARLRPMATRRNRRVEQRPRIRPSLRKRGLL